MFLCVYFKQISSASIELCAPHSVRCSDRCPCVALLQWFLGGLIMFADQKGRATAKTMLLCQTAGSDQPHLFEFSCSTSFPSQSCALVSGQGEAGFVAVPWGTMSALSSSPSPFCPVGYSAYCGSLSWRREFTVGTGVICRMLCVCKDRWLPNGIKLV